MAYVTETIANTTSEITRIRNKHTRDTLISYEFSLNKNGTLMLAIKFLV
jgi:hypothetical protein